MILVVPVTSEQAHMRKTINFSVSEEMYEFILEQVREHYHYSVSGYLRSLVSRDEAYRRNGTTAAKKSRGPITMNEFMAMPDEDY